MQPIIFLLGAVLGVVIFTFGKSIGYRQGYKIGTEHGHAKGELQAWNEANEKILKMRAEVRSKWS